MTPTRYQLRADDKVSSEAEKRMAVRWHLAWVVAAGLATAALMEAGILTAGPELAALTIVGAAACFGALLSAMGQGPARVLAVLMWAGAGAAACELTGGPSGPFAALCLTPLAAAAAFRQPKLLSLGAVAGVGAAALAAMGAVLFAPARPVEAISLWLSLLALGATSLSLAAGLVALQGRVRGEVLRSRDSEAALRHLVDRQSHLLMVLDHQGRVLQAFGEPPPGLGIGSVIGRPLALLAAPDVREGVEAAIARAIATGAADIGFVPAHDPEGWETLGLRRMGPQQINATLHDTRAQRAREIALEQARVAADQQNAGKSRFLANMSHELRTPLNAIMGFSDIMRQRLFGPMSDRYGEYADLIHESGSHLLELINDVLDMSKIEAERFELAREDFDARDAITAVLRLMRGQADRAGIKLRGVLPAGSLDCDADRRAIKQIAMNLVSNALKFTPKGGAVTLTVQGVGPVLELVVTDTGVGISSSDLERLGQPYEQAGDAEQKQGGSGLGLSLVRAFAKLHGGDMTLESVVGQGTTVTVRMPVLLPVATPRGIDARAEG